MSLFSGGSTLSLLGHELRLVWRGRGKAGRNRGRIIALAVALGVLGFTLGLPFALALGQVPETPPPAMALAIDAGVVVLLTLMLSQTVSAAALNFYERGDLDLLLSAPIPPHRVLTVRCFSMAVTASGFFMLLVTPVVAPAIALGHPKWLTVYLVLAALALFATALGLAIATTLFRLIGPRRTKTLAQVMAAVIGATLFLSSQSRYFLTKDQTADLTAHALAFARSGLFAPDQPLAWPALGVMGRPIPALGLLAGSLVLFLLVVRGLGRRFAKDAAAAAGVGVGGRRTAKGGVRGFEGGPFGAMVRKELRLLLRDPALLSQVLLRVLYLVPLAFILVRGAGGNGHGWLGGAAIQFLGPQAWIARGGALLVFVTTQLAGTLAWITVSAEDAPELLASAPVRAGLLRRAKLTAAMTPVAAILIAPLAWLGYLHPWAGGVTALGCLAAGLSACLIAVWYEKPARRQDLRRRRGGSLVGAMAEIFIGFCWAAATWLGVMGMIWAVIPALVAIVTLIAIRRPERSFVEVLQLT